MNGPHATAGHVNRLHIRQAARVLAVALALGALLSTIQIAIDLHYERRNVHAAIGQVLDSLSRPASQAAFSVSPYLAEGVVDSLLKYQPIHSAAIATETGVVLAQRSRPVAPDRLAWLSGWLTRGEREFTLPLHAPNLQDPVGRITVQIDASVLAAGVLPRAGLTVLFDILKNTALALAVTVVFYYTLSRPLTALSQALAEAQQLRTATSLHVRLGRHADKEMVALLAAANRFLENQVEARTEALRQQNDELQRLNTEVQAARAEAENATQAKSQFLANMSHELRTPLNAILGYAQILDRDGGLTERQQRGITTIERSGTHLLSLINDVLDLSRIEAAKCTLEPQPVMLPAFIEGIGDIIRVKAEEKLLRFACTLDPDLPAAVLCDEKRLRQVLLNLLGNAVKFTASGQVSLRIGRQPPAPHDAPDAARLRFTVQDSGVGMTAQELTRIFQPFEQAGDVARRASGTGLGLAISAQIVALMGGRIEVHSAPEQGSRFWFELVVSLAANATASAAAPVITGYQGPRRSVLVIDDQDGNRAMLADLLEGLGFDTWEAIDGQSGLDSMAHTLPDLVITDIAMPGIDGLELLRRLRADPVLGRVPVIAVSASISMAGEAASLEAGATAFVPKPVSQALLLERIGACLQLRWITGAAPAPAEAPTDAPMLAPPQADIEQLYALAMTGNMRSIHRYAAELMARDARYQPFAARLQALADAYQSRAILALAQHHLGLPS